MASAELQIGRVTVRHVPDYILWVDAQRLFPDVKREQWDCYRNRPYAAGLNYLNDQGQMRVTLGSYLLSSEGRTILIDTGIGPNDRRPRMNAGPGDLLSNLDAAGMSPNDIDLVLFTHLHIDHVGWNLTEENGTLRPTFPNARYLVLRSEWEYWTDPSRMAEEENAFLKGTVAPLTDVANLELVDHETPITRDITFLPLPGHTPGHTGFVIASAGEYGYISGDATIHPAQIAEPEWWIFPDVNPSDGIGSRRKLLEMVVERNAPLISGHHVEPGYGRVTRTGNAYSWSPLEG